MSIFRTLALSSVGTVYIWVYGYSSAASVTALIALMQCCAASLIALMQFFRKRDRARGPEELEEEDVSPGMTPGSITFQFTKSHP